MNGVNTQLSHEGYNEFCSWKKLIPQDRNYQQSEDYKEGVFFAKEEMAWQQEGNEIGGSFRFAQSTITISTPDFVESMDKDDLVMFRDEWWKVVKVQKRAIKSTTRYRKLPYYITYIEMRK